MKLVFYHQAITIQSLDVLGFWDSLPLFSEKNEGKHWKIETNIGFPRVFRMFSTGKNENCW